MTAHSENTQKVLEQFGSDPARGLTTSQVTAAHQKYGANKLREKKRKTNLQRFAE